MNAAVVIETIRRQFTSIAFVATALGVVVFAILAAQLNPGAIWTEFATLAVLIAGAQVLGPEFSSGTLQLILTKPVNRSVYVVSRVAGAVLSSWIVIAAGCVTEVLARLYLGSTRDLADVAILAVNEGTKALIVCALLAFFGSFLRAYFNVAMYLLGSIMLQALVAGLPVIQNAKKGFFAVIGRILTNNPWIGRSLRWLVENVYPQPPRDIDGPWMLLVASNAVIIVILTCLVYRRREVPYGAD